MSNKYNPPSGPPPTYPPQIHHDAGPYYESQHGPGSPPPSGSPYNTNNQQVGPYNARAQDYQVQGYYGGPEQEQVYSENQPPPGGYYGAPQGGYYNQPQGPMYYQQQPPAGYYANNRGYGQGGSAAEGMCAGLLGALACCCCLDMLI